MNLFALCISGLLEIRQTIADGAMVTRTRIELSYSPNLARNFLEYLDDALLVIQCCFFNNISERRVIDVLDELCCCSLEAPVLLASPILDFIL